MVNLFTARLEVTFQLSRENQMLGILGSMLFQVRTGYTKVQESKMPVHVPCNRSSRL